MLLTEGEWECVKDEPHFALIDGTVNDEAKALGKGILPFGTPAFDLRSIAWESPSLSNRLAARCSRRNLFDIIAAMRLVGAVVEGVSETDDDRPMIVDAIVSAAKNMGWEDLGESVRGRLPAVETDGAGGVLLPEGTLEEITSGGDAPRRAFSAPAGEPQPRFPKNQPVVMHFPAEGAESDKGGEGGEEGEAPVVQAPRKRKLKTVKAPRKRGRLFVS
jgi:hypothetical protein